MGAALRLKASAGPVLAVVPGAQAIGAIWYLLSPERGSAWGGPFNGQTARQALFKSIVANTRPRAIIETGTYFGTTTDLLGQMNLPVFTVETHRLYYGFVRARFWRRKHISAIHGDSRTVLRQLFTGPLRSWGDSTLFFYLDAHWRDDLPLSEEIDIAFSRCPSAVVMIDDFQVPADSGYGYDDYGPGKSLDFAYIRAGVSAHQLNVYYPSTPSAVESGARRGCVVLAKGAIHGDVLDSSPLLRRFIE